MAIASFLLIHNSGDGTDYVIDYTDHPDKIFKDAAEYIAYGDCTDETVVKSVYRGHSFSYVGWQSGMLFEFRDDETGEIIYSNSFPQWEH